jgi:transposase
MNITRKVIERRHIGRSPHDRLAYLQRVAQYEHIHLIDIDETASSPDQFIERYGWSTRGNPCVHTQFVLGNRHFSSIAAYTPFGFLCWQIIEGGDGGAFRGFLQDFLERYILDDHIAIIDNAKIHKTDESLAVLERVFGGRYIFRPANSPDYKPIELGFADIKRFLRGHEYEAINSPIRWINNAFDYFAVNGEGRGRGK